jgi:hypothetical protein
MAPARPASALPPRRRLRRTAFATGLAAGMLAFAAGVGGIASWSAGPAPGAAQRARLVVHEPAQGECPYRDTAAAERLS